MSVLSASTQNFFMCSSFISDFENLKQGLSCPHAVIAPKLTRFAGNAGGMNTTLETIKLS